MSESTAFFGQPKRLDVEPGGHARILPVRLSVDSRRVITSDWSSRAWELVAEALRTQLRATGDVGAACCVYVDGEPVVDISAGIARRARAVGPWHDDTLAVVFSTTKGATAICANLLIERGRARPRHARRRRTGPSSRANGKADVPCAPCSRTAPGCPWSRATSRSRRHSRGIRSWSSSRADAALGTGGAAPGYHVRSVRLAGRASSCAGSPARPLGQFFADEIARSARARLVDRAARGARSRGSRTLIPPPPPEDPEVRELMDAFMAPGHDDRRRAHRPVDLFHYDEMWNTRALHACELPSSNGIASAHAVARMYAATVGAGRRRRMLSPPTDGRARDRGRRSDGHRPS